MATVKIKGMSCQHCVASITEALNKIPGITKVEVNLQRGEASYEGEIEADLVQQLIRKTGFEVE